MKSVVLLETRKIVVLWMCLHLVTHLLENAIRLRQISALGTQVKKNPKQTQNFTVAVAEIFFFCLSLLK